MSNIFKHCSSSSNCSFLQLIICCPACCHYILTAWCSFVFSLLLCFYSWNICLSWMIRFPATVQNPTCWVNYRKCFIMRRICTAVMEDLDFLFKILFMGQLLINMFDHSHVIVLLFLCICITMKMAKSSWIMTWLDYLTAFSNSSKSLCLFQLSVLLSCLGLCNYFFSSLFPLHSLWVVAKHKSKFSII